MIALAIVIAAVLIIALLRFGVHVEYSERGFAVRALAGPFSFSVLPRKESSKRAAAGKKGGKKKKPKEKKEKKEESGSGQKLPGKFQYFLEILSAVRTALGRLRHRLLIRHLTIWFTAGNEDPSKTAMMFGGANAAFGTVLQFMDKHFRIRRRDLRASADFTSDEIRIYLSASVSLAVWELVYIAVALLPLLTKRPKNKKTGTTGKEVQKNGKTPDKRLNGDNDAESAGDGRRKHDRRRTDNDA